MDNSSFRKFGDEFRKNINTHFTKEMNLGYPKPYHYFTWSKLASILIGKGSYNLEKNQYENFIKEFNTTYNKYDDGGETEEVYIEFLNKEKGFKKDTKYFNSYEEAVKWARENFDKFNPDMIKYTYADGGETKESFVRALDEASREYEELQHKDYVLHHEEDRGRDWQNPNAKEDAQRDLKRSLRRKEIISIQDKIDNIKKEYFEGKEGKSELLKAIKFLNDIGIKSEWNGSKGEFPYFKKGYSSANWWLKDAKTEFTYIGNQDAQQLIKFATNLQNSERYKGLSVKQIKEKRELERKKEEIEKERARLREESDDNKWIVKYISTMDDDVASVWVIAENREDAILQAKEDNWDIGEVISVESYAKGGGVDIIKKDRYSDGGAIYPDLSLEKAQVVNDSVQLAEFQIKKSKNIFKISGIENLKVTKSDEVVNILRSLFEKDTMSAYEQSFILYLNSNNNIIGYYHHSSGGIDGTVMDIQMISGLAVKSLAKGVIVSHNHPSENTKPSDADKRITKQLDEALKLFNIKLLDSIILTENSYLSFRDAGILV
jgi:DNA repair protein RadC